MTELFETLAYHPLAERMRPKQLNDLIGQEHLIGANKPLTLLIESGQLPSMIFWGPPGTGKTTLARIIINHTDHPFHSISAVLSGISDLRQIIKQAKESRQLGIAASILFIDEIHRWNKSQQDALLPHVEDGTIILIASTTENPSFEIIHALLSRTKVFTLKPLEQAAIHAIIDHALTNATTGLGHLELSIHADAHEFLSQSSQGDARKALVALEMAANLTHSQQDTIITLSHIEAAMQKQCLLYDKKGEEHYNVISAFIKSMRGSDPHASLYYLARMIESGESARFICRRMVIFASEDIGNADPHAIQVATSCMQAYEFIGDAQGWIPMSQCASYLATAPKSNASYMGYKQAKKDIHQYGHLPVPMHLRNAPTQLMKNLGYGQDYQYAHDYKHHIAPDITYLPDDLLQKKYYRPSDQGYEKNISQRMEQWKQHIQTPQQSKK